MTEHDARLVAPECADYGKPEDQPQRLSVWEVLLLAAVIGGLLAIWGH